MFVFFFVFFTPVRNGCLSPKGASSTPRPQREDAPNWEVSWTLGRASSRGPGDARRVQVRLEFHLFMAVYASGGGADRTRLE